jgi:hypothetical protein
MTNLISIAATLLLTATTVAGAQGTGWRGHTHVETGLEVGGAVGVESRAHSSVRAISEIGYLWEQREKPWGIGGTFYAGLGQEDMRLGLKPRLRYRFRPEWSIDVSAGVIFATLENEQNVSDTGFVGGAHLNYGGWFTARLDVNVKKFADWTTVHRNVPVVHEGGYETAVYGGVALRGHAGWVATAVGVAGFFALMLFVLGSGGAS